MSSSNENEYTKNKYSAKSPYTAVVESIKHGPTVEKGAVGDSFIVKFNNIKTPLINGCIISIIPPGQKAKTGRSHDLRHYHVSNAKYDKTTKNWSCEIYVRYATYTDPETGKNDPGKDGVCSHFLYRLKPGSECQICGPNGNALVHPNYLIDNKFINDNTDIISDDLIYIVTGTGFGIFKYVCEDILRNKYIGKITFYAGFATSANILYGDDNEVIDLLEKIKKLKVSSNGKYGNLEVKFALSREQLNNKGGKMYVQDRVEEDYNNIMSRMDTGKCIIYFIGLKGMMPGIINMFETNMKKNNKDWNKILDGWKKTNQWREDVY